MRGDKYKWNSIWWWGYVGANIGTALYAALLLWTLGW